MSIIKNIIWVLAVLFVLASCSSEEDAPGNTNHDVTVSFTLSLGSPQQVTRAGAFTSDTTAENRLDVDGMQVVLYDNVGHYFSRVEHLTMNRIDATTYNVVGVMRVDTLNLATNNQFSGKLAIYANTDASSIQEDSLRQEAVQELSYDFDPSSTLTSIPMWGIKTVSNVNLTPGRQANLGEVWMLRAMAKVTVDLTQDMKNRGYSLTSVTLNNYNTRGFVLPAEYSAIENSNAFSGQASDTSFRSYTNTAFASSSSINFTNRTLYLPEYDNSSNPATITVVINNTNGDTRTATFSFGRYSGGDYSSSLNIIRNHSYHFNVYGNPIKIDLTVEPWTKFDHTPYEL